MPNREFVELTEPFSSKQTSVSVKRINKFMNCEELDPENVQHEPTHGN